MKTKILLVTPPFVQLNTPYPATAYLKGFLNTKKIPSAQIDLGIETVLHLFSKNGLIKLFDIARGKRQSLTENARRMLALADDYLDTIDPTIAFLQGQDPTLAYNICEGGYLPQASRFAQLEDLDWAFGTLGIRDKARHLATLYLEDISDLLKEAADPHFGFSRYAERLGLAALSFDPLEKQLQGDATFIDAVYLDILEAEIQKEKPNLICFTAPFPGNVYAALRCGKFVKEKYPEIKTVFGGGFANTELRSLKEKRFFKYMDFVCLDDGEAPLECLTDFLEGNRPKESLKRVFALHEDEVRYFNGTKEKDVPQRETGTPDYAGLPLKSYLSVIEIANPMHRLWSDGRWNKLTLAHGCYWGKCSFCDVSLDYIKRYEPLTAALLCDRIEEIIAQTGETGFHFVDEAAPPALMKELAIEILARGITLTWWTNIRFEKNFTADLCRLLRASGCIAVSGGLEVASDRLLEKMKKGVTVAQVAQVTDNFARAGIMTHAYLMYGFPTQTAQETIDSLEMVRQLFEAGVVQSGFWHRFAMTAHSPVGLAPEQFGAVRLHPGEGVFANNDLEHGDPQGCRHELFSEGLRKSLYNYMHGQCFDMPLADWFGFKTPPTQILPSFIADAIQFREENSMLPHRRVLWLGKIPEIEEEEKKNKKTVRLLFRNKTEDFSLKLPEAEARWLSETLPLLKPGGQVVSFADFQAGYESRGLGEFDYFVVGRVWPVLREKGLRLV